MLKINAASCHLAVFFTVRNPESSCNLEIFGSKTSLCLKVNYHHQSQSHVRIKSILNGNKSKQHKKTAIRVLLVNSTECLSVCCPYYYGSRSGLCMSHSLLRIW